MRSMVVVIVTLFFCAISLFTILTIDTYMLQNDELEKALDFALVQTMRDPATDPDEIAIKAAENFKSQINSSRGALTVYVLYADENIVDMAVSLSYTQYNGTKKEIEKRKTIIRDWEEGKENESIVRMIGLDYFGATPEKGGLKGDSVWKTNSLLHTVLKKSKIDEEWKNPQFQFDIKTGK